MGNRMAHNKKEGAAVEPIGPGVATRIAGAARLLPLATEPRSVRPRVPKSYTSRDGGARRKGGGPPAIVGGLPARLPPQARGEPLGGPSVTYGCGPSPP